MSRPRTTIKVDPSGLFAHVTVEVDGLQGFTTLSRHVTASSPEVAEFRRRLLHEPKPKEDNDGS